MAARTSTISDMAATVTARPVGGGTVTPSGNAVDDSTTKARAGIPISVTISVSSDSVRSIAGLSSKDGWGCVYTVV